MANPPISTIDFRTGAAVVKADNFQYTFPIKNFPAGSSLPPIVIDPSVAIAALKADMDSRMDALMAAVKALSSGTGGTGGTGSTGDNFPADPTKAPTSPDDSQIIVFNGAIAGPAYLKDKNGGIWTLALIGGIGVATINGTTVTGGGTGSGINQMIVRQGSVFFIIGTGQVQYWDPGRGSTYNTTLPPSTNVPPTTPTMPPMPVASAIAPGGSGRIIQAGPTRALKTLSEAIPTALAGDKVQLDPGTYTDTPHAWDVPLLIDLGGATLNGAGKTDSLAHGKALLCPNADSIIQNGTIINVAMDQGSGQLTSAIRPESGCGYLTIRHIVAHENQCAIGHGGFPVVITVEDSDISNNGLHANSGALTHDLYVGNDCVVLTLTNVVANGANEAHAIKFRGHKLVVNGGTFASSPGKPFDLPDGVTVPFSMTGVTIIKNAGDGDHGVIAVGEESTTNGLFGNIGTINGGTIRANCDHPTLLGQAGTITLTGVTRTGNPLETAGGIILA